MRQYIIEIDEAVAETIQRDAKQFKVSEEQRICSVLTAYHEEYQQFADGILRAGRQKLVALLSQIPCLRNFDSSGVDFRYWWVRFDLDTSSPIAWKVIRKLGFHLNSQSTEMALPTVFKPIPGEWPETAEIPWQISSTAPRLDPTEVFNWLKLHLPQPISDEQTWMNEEI